jgi:hypothetical protein
MDQSLIEDLLCPASRHPNELKKFVGFKIVAGIIGPNCLERISIPFNELLLH